MRLQFFRTGLGMRLQFSRACTMEHCLVKIFSNDEIYELF